LVTDYLPILIFFVIVFGLGCVLVLLPVLISPKRPSVAKELPYECGIVPQTPARRRFAVGFYLTAMLFIIFDVEAIFVYPWAVLLKQLKVFGLIEMAVFIGILFVGLVYAWGKGALEWQE
jgi:NADH-quinone oxidoreductase subunit A